jgi:hypothetical protein
MTEGTLWGPKYDIVGGWSANLTLADYGRVARHPTTIADTPPNLR